jgi:hypothetical protein
MKFFNEFDRKVRQLERRTGNDASRIEWLVKNSPDIRRLVGSLYFRDREFESELAKHRFLLSVPKWFFDSYKSYKERFGSEVDRVYGKLWLLAFPDDEVDGIPAEEIFHPDGRPPGKDGNDGNNDEIAGWFTPSMGGGAEAVDFIIHWLWNMHEDYDSAEDLRTGLDAWDWFIETAGIDLAKIEERWKKLPRALIPSHMERAASAGGREGFIDLLDDATKAYIFGLPAAAIAMCRAVCEHVLKEFYFSDDGNEKTLGNLVYLAEKKYKDIKKMKLREYINKANKLMHSYQGGQLSENELEVVRQFLETTKGLIELAPPKPTERP